MQDRELQLHCAAAVELHAVEHQLIEEHWPTFLERAEQSGGLPDFIVEEFEAYLRCGMLEHGLAHFACRRCGESLVVAYSCKTRGFCPSCTGRRMADVAAHLVDERSHGSACARSRTRYSVRSPSSSAPTPRCG
jgi:hypothetical protein